MNIDICCDKLKKAIKNEIIDILERDSKIYIFNDGGHGGMYEITYCPFCGKLLKIVQRERLNEETEEKCPICGSADIRIDSNIVCYTCAGL